MAEWEWVIVAVFGILCGMLKIWTEHKQEMAKIAKGLVPRKRVKPPIEPIAGLLMAGQSCSG